MLRKKLLTVTLLAVLFTVVVVTARPSEAVTLSPVAFGETRDFGNSAIPGPVQVLKTFTFEGRGTFEFDIGALTGPVLSAQLVLPIVGANFNSVGRTVDMFSYSGNGTLEFLNDFTAGTQFGSFVVAMSGNDTKMFDLTAVVNSLIAASATHLGVRGAFDLSGGSRFQAGLRFDNNPDLLPSLNVELGMAPVPLPAALPLFAGGLGLLGLLGWRRKRAAA